MGRAHQPADARSFVSRATGGGRAGRRARTPLVLATTNPGKLAELRRLLRGSGLQTVGLGRFGAFELNERGASYKANAALKARQVALRLSLPALADDSGIEVRALAGRPGIRSARWQPTVAARNRALLRALRGRSDRRARFVAALALALPSGKVYVRQAACAGRIAPAPRGRLGFGYDPLFVVRGGEGRTVAELQPGEKDRLGHRGAAIRKLWPLLHELARGRLQ
jgi:XTP/dITP diphosphohydrolase